MSETLAIYGGSFNPPHVAHQMAALLVLETQAVDRVVVIPTHRHPFSKNHELVAFEHRMQMCRLAFALFGERVVVSEIERELGHEVSRSIYTLQALAERHPEASLRFVVGADIIAEKDSWYRWDEIEALAPPIVVGRTGYSGGGASPGELELPDVSSTEVRARLSRGESALPLVSRAVMNYIAGHGLYR